MEPDTPARVVVDERTGTVVIGRDVQISTVAVTHGNLTVRITESADRLPAVAVLASAARRSSCRKHSSTPMSRARRSRSCAAIDLQRLVRGLNQIGLKPSGIIAILQAIKTAGALQADLVIQ